MEKEDICFKDDSDLYRFKKKYERCINDFLESNPETNIVFLDADFGWGKTKFVKEVLRIKEKNIFSPWMNPSKNYIEEIYEYTDEFANKKENIKIGIWIFIGFILTFLIPKILDLLLLSLVQYDLICKISIIILDCFLILLVYIVVLVICNLKNNISFFKLSSKKYNINIEPIIVKKIVGKINSCLVIEDIDRIDDIQEVLITIKKISDEIDKQKKESSKILKRIEIKKNEKGLTKREIKQKYDEERKCNKYILLTGDYARTLKRLNDPKKEENYTIKLNETNTFDKGAYTLERMVSCRIKFLSEEQRIDNLLKEYHLNNKIEKIEKDELLKFIKSKFLSIRFFIKFLYDEKEELEKEKSSIFLLFINYYIEKKLINMLIM